MSWRSASPSFSLLEFRSSTRGGITPRISWLVGASESLGYPLSGWCSTQERLEGRACRPPGPPARPLKGDVRGGIRDSRLDAEPARLNLVRASFSTPTVAAVRAAAGMAGCAGPRARSASCRPRRPASGSRLSGLDGNRGRAGRRKHPGSDRQPADDEKYPRERHRRAASGGEAGTLRLLGASPPPAPR